MTADTNTPAAAPAGKQRPQLPEGIVSPISALNTLKQRKLAAEDFKPQQMYGFVKNPGKTDPFPVQHYDAQGNAYDQPQVNEHGITTTRPGVVVDEVVDWWSRKGERDVAKAEAKKAKAAEKAAKAEATSANTAQAPAAAEEEDGEEVGADEDDFEEAE